MRAMQYLGLRVGFVSLYTSKIPEDGTPLHVGV
jgi:hypothetical protein